MNHDKGGRFQSGNKVNAGRAPWNKDRHGVKSGSFKAGHKRNSKPVGTVRFEPRGGYFLRKVSDTGDQYRDWIGLHVLAWQAAHGAIPVGHVVVFRNGDRSNAALENLECITRGELIRRNSWKNLPEALQEVVQLKAALTRKINGHD
ncbi:hypothetical protein BSFA1_10520 [Burkholderia sp. SFA1]|nr:hypothetical protein BSFA1_10520 [Burkholderia sp. SFA1]